MFEKFKEGNSAYAQKIQGETAVKEALAAPEKLRSEVMEKSLSIIINEKEGEDNIQQAINAYFDLKIRLSKTSELDSGTERVRTAQDDNLELQALTKIAGLLAKSDDIDNSVLTRSFMEELVGQFEKDNVIAFPQEEVVKKEPDEPVPAQQQVA